MIRSVAVSLLLLVVSGCTSMQWHCESDIEAIANACTKAQMSLMKSVPLECNKGADAEARVSAKSTESGFVRNRTEAAIQCK